jgi:D-glycero-D-manno-heptose 1,7-bisphosphate phosphatase
MKLVVLDRDGVINFDSADYIKNASEWIPVPGSIEAIAALSQAGFEVVIATNQAGLARGLFGVDELECMHDKLRGLVEARQGRVGAIFYCPHGPEDGCDCRKPGTGLLDAIEREYGCSLSGCCFIGDSMKDVLAARRKGCRPVLVRTGNGSATEAQLDVDGDCDVAVFDDLAAAARALVNGFW